MPFFDRILRLGEGRDAKRVQKVVDRVNALGPEHEAMSDDALKARTAEFRQRIERGEELDDLLPEAFATVREAAWRVLAQRPYDVQVFGGVVLHGGNIAEMRTGEGKTLTSTMPVYLNALAGDGVHVVTVNDYLARRDAEWMGRVHNFMGLEVGLTYPRQPKADKRRNYAMDITHGTTNEFGFDYLRDNMAWSRGDQVQRGHHMALIDEVDSILVDEARTPLIISGQGEASAEWYGVFARKVAPVLKRGEEITKPGGYREQTEDYVVDEAKRNVAITEQGVAKVEEVLGMDNLYESVNTPLIQHLQNCLKAKELYQRDREYIVDNGEVKIVDESTGRVLEGRRYSEGLHQAIEAKEGVKVKDENQTLATITLQNYYRTYDKLAGMTGTAKTEEIELLEIYELGVVVVPTNRPVVRDDMTDVIYKTAAAKFEAVADDIAARHEAGQPVLVGTTDVAKSEHVHQLLTKRGIPHEVLNAKNHTREGLLVAQAGRPGAVTVSTNMAGRGTDIQLGGNAEELAREDVSRAEQQAQEAGEPLTDEQSNEVYREAVERHEAAAAEAKQHVLDAGGLYVIGTERHESRRIDNQLRGRSGRQGDPGASKFYLSLEDDLMRLFNASAVESIMKRLQIPDDVPIEAKLVGKAISNAQGQVESRNFDIRKNVLKYDDVLNEQRKVIYEQRQRLLEGDADDVEALAQRYVEKAIEDLVDVHCPPGVYPEEWTLDDLQVELAQVYDTEYDVTAIDLETVEREDFLDDLIDDVDDAYARREDQVGGEAVMREVERRVILSVVDRHWREHLYEMTALRDGIGLRAVGQRDPLVEYQREAYDSFVALLQAARREAVTYFFRIPVDPPQAEDGDEDGDDTAGASAPTIAMPGHNAPKVDPSGSVAAEGAGGLEALRQRREAAAQRPAPARVSRPAAATAPMASRPDVGIAQPSQPRLTYSSGGGGSASYGVRATAASTPAGAPPSDTAAASGAPPTEPVDGTRSRDDGTTVREVARGGTYVKDTDDPYATAKPNDPCPCGSGRKFKKCYGKPGCLARD